MKKLLLLAAGAMLATTMNAQDAIYLVGNMQEGGNWDINSDEYTLPAIEEGVYEATFEFPEHLGGWWFSFYKELGEWNDNVRISPAVNDQELDFTNGVFVSENCISGSTNSWNLVNWAGGELTMNVNTNTMTVTFTTSEDYEPATPPEADESIIYLIGTPNDWNISNGDFKLESTSEGVYVGEFDLKENSELKFRFYTELTIWGNDGELPSIGSGPKDGVDVNISLADGEYNGSCTPGKGSWIITNWPGGIITMVVDINNWTVTFSTDVEIAPLPDDEFPEDVYFLGNVVDNSWNPADPILASDYNDGVFYFSNLTLKNDDGSGTSWFTFTNLITEDWNVINSGTHRYGPAPGVDGALTVDSEVEFSLGGNVSFNIPDGTYSFALDFNNMTLTVSEGNAGVEGIEVDLNAPAVYYNLQGVKVENPGKGVYVVKQGNKTAKVVLK